MLPNIETSAVTLGVSPPAKAKVTSVAFIPVKRWSLSNFSLPEVLPYVHRYP